MSTLLLLGSGPGIGLSSAKALAATGHFAHIALCSRNASRLADDAESLRQHISSNDSSSGKTNVEVETFPLDLTDFHALRRTIERVKDMGKLSCVLFNAARIKPAEPLKASVEELEEDFRTAALALYVTAQETIPILSQASGTTSRPAFIVTNSHLPESPVPEVLVLSVVKAAQQNMIQSLDAAFGSKVEFAVVKIKGTVGTADGHIRPEAVAQKVANVYQRAVKGEKVELLIEIDP